MRVQARKTDRILSWRLASWGVVLMMLLASAPLPQSLRPIGTAQASVQIDTPSTTYGFPGDNTWGYTTVWPTLHTSRSDVSDPLGFDVPMDLGEFNRLSFVPAKDAYWMDVDFDVRVRMWNDTNGVYNPAPPCMTDDAYEAVGDFAGDTLNDVACLVSGDDACPSGSISLFDVAIVIDNVPYPLRTVTGTLPDCATNGDPPESPVIAIDADPMHPTDPANRFYIPKDLLDGPGGVYLPIHCFEIRFTPRDLVLPAYSPDHVKAQDGVFLSVESVMVQLVAPPLVTRAGAH